LDGSDEQCAQHSAVVVSAHIYPCESSLGGILHYAAGETLGSDRRALVPFRLCFGLVQVFGEETIPAMIAGIWCGNIAQFALSRENGDLPARAGSVHLHRLEPPVAGRG
jgi:hypothetical protein